MKKLHLKKLNLGPQEVLKRLDLASIYGGSGSGSTSHTGTCNWGCGGPVTDCSNETMEWFCKDSGGPAFCV